MKVPVEALSSWCYVRMSRCMWHRVLSYHCFLWFQVQIIATVTRLVLAEKHEWAFPSMFYFGTGEKFQSCLLWLYDLLPATVLAMSLLAGLLVYLLLSSVFPTSDFCYYEESSLCLWDCNEGVLRSSLIRLTLLFSYGRVGTWLFMHLKCSSL